MGDLKSTETARHEADIAIMGGGPVAMALSLGDLGAIALFGSQDVVTLPYLLLQRMGSYRTSDAAGLALVALPPKALSHLRFEHLLDHGLDLLPSELIEGFPGDETRASCVRFLVLHGWRS